MARSNSWHSVGQRLGDQWVGYSVLSVAGQSNFIAARLGRPLTWKVWHEAAVGIGDVNHDSIESRVSRSRVSIGKMIKPDPCAHGIVPSQWDHHTRAKIESHVHTAGVRCWHIMRERQESAINVKEGLPAPRYVRRKLQSDRTTTTVRVLTTIGDTSRMNDERLYIQISTDEKMTCGEKPGSEADAGEEESVIIEIAHELWICESSTRVDRKFSVVARGSCRSDDRFETIRIGVDEI
jgi:hypothetical protein